MYPVAHSSVTDAVSEELDMLTRQQIDALQERLLITLEAQCTAPEWVEPHDRAKVVRVFKKCVDKLANFHPSRRELENALIALTKTRPKEWDVTGKCFGLEINIERCDANAQPLPAGSVEWLLTTDTRNFYSTNRDLILIRDGGLCVYCGADVLLEGAHMDHLIPQWLVPVNEDETALALTLHSENKPVARQNSSANVVTACACCNFAKAGRLPFPRDQMAGKTRGQVIQRLRDLLPTWKAEKISPHIKAEIVRLRAEATRQLEALGVGEYALLVWRHCAANPSSKDMKEQALANLGEKYLQLLRTGTDALAPNALLPDKS
jgi:hypothetical protein